MFAEELTKKKSKIFRNSNCYCGSKIFKNWDLEYVQPLGWNKFSLRNPEFPCWKGAGVAEACLFVSPLRPRQFFVTV